MRKIYIAPEKNTKLWRILIVGCALILLFSSSVFASPQINEISSKEAVELATFYYCCNTTEPVKFDQYTITPLYDEEGSITYYCVDFFNDGIGKGYVVIGQNLNYLQCPELALDGNSWYYSNALSQSKTIYYNPFERYVQTTEENIYYDISNQKIDKENIDGSIYDGKLLENRSILNNVDGVTSPADERDSFEVHPMVYLENLGYTQISCTSYGTIETAMQQANAFNPMYDIPSYGKLLTDGTRLRNSGHCAITAMANIFMYWKAQGAVPNAPSSYDDMFTAVCNKACELGYFSKNKTYNAITGQYENAGVYHGYVQEIMREFARDYGSGSFNYSSNEADWDFLTWGIDAGWPIYLRFGHDNPMDTEDEFIYSYHATVAFGYNIMQAVGNSGFVSYKFAKLYDGWDSYEGISSTGKRYIPWSALTNSVANISTDENGNVIDHSIKVNMYIIGPSTGESEW